MEELLVKPVWKSESCMLSSLILFQIPFGFQFTQPKSERQAVKSSGLVQPFKFKIPLWNYNSMTIIQ